MYNEEFNKDTLSSLKAVSRKTITSIELIQNYYDDYPAAEINSTLAIMFGDNLGINIYDDGQDCCERRYMHTDDKLSEFVGATLLEVETRDCPITFDEHSDPIESQFLIVTTSKGVFTVVNYNEHNGYYGGLSIQAKLFFDKDGAGAWGRSGKLQ